MTGPSIAELEARLAASSVPPIDPVRHIDALTELAWALRNTEEQRAHALAREARELAIVRGYKLGQARAARTMAMTVRDIEDMPALFQLAARPDDLPAGFIQV